MEVEVESVDNRSIVRIREALLHGSGRRWNSPFPKR